MFYRMSVALFVITAIIACSSTSEPARSPLHQAAYVNDANSLNSLLAQPNANINEVDEKGNTPLMTAIEAGQYSAAMLLIEKGANIHAENNASENAFLMLSRQAEPPLELLRATFDINLRINQVVDDKSLVELFESSESLSSNAKPAVVALVSELVNGLSEKRERVMAAMDGDDFSAVKAYVEEGGHLNFETQSFYTPLMKATNIGNLDAMQAVIDLGADVNYRDSRFGEPAIFETISSGDIQAMKLLIQNGADVSIKIENDITILMRAVMWNNIPMVELLLDSGADINAASKSGWAPLHWTVNSAENQNHDATQVANILIQRGANINAQNKSGYTALNLATVNSHPGVFNLLIEAGADVHIGSSDDYSPIINAIYYDQYEMVKSLIAAGVDVNKPGNDLWAPVHWTVNNEENQKHSGSRYLKLLIDAGADVNAQNDSGNTPARLAAANQREEEMALLIEAGANLDLPNENGHTPLITAVIFNNPNLVKMLIEGGADINKAEPDGWAPIHWSVNSQKELPGDSSEVVQLLVDVGAELNTAVPSGNTPVRLAAANDRLSELKILLKAGANPNIGNDSGYTPLMDAIGSNNMAMAKLLIAHGADINQADNDGWTPLHWTVNDKSVLKHDASPFAQLLIEAGAELNAVTKRNYTALNMSILNGHIPVYELLIAAKADINIATVDGYSPLIHATTTNRPDIVKQLLAAGANTKQATDDGWTAIHFTVNNDEYQKHDGTEILQLLLDAGVDFEATIEAGFTPLMLASYNGRLNEAKLLLQYGANPKSANKKNGDRKPLDYAVISGNDEIISILKKHLTAS